MSHSKFGTILIVEDELLIAMSEKITLEDHGYEVFIAKNGELAIDIVKKNSSIDLVLMDINLGRGMDGTKTAEKILEYKELPIVFLSSHTEADVVKKTEGISSYGYIVKNSIDTILIASVKMAYKLFESRKNEKKKTSALKESEHRLRHHLRETPMAVIEWDLNFCVTSWNPAAEKIFGYKEKEVLGEHASFIIPESSKKEVDKVWSKLLLHEGGQRNVNDNITKEGKIILCDWYNTTLTSLDGKVVGVASIVQKIEKE